jgi:peptidoglycan/LPS O-acetylase OafA/YrhL
MSADRLHALDAVRAFALMLGIFFHGAAGYVENFPETLWPMIEPSSATLGLLFFVSHMFRMSLFFLIAGFFGRMLIERRGTAGFVRDRAKRILVPLVAGLPIVLMLFAALAGLGFLLSGMSRAELLQLSERQSATPVEESTFPWAHLWFLYYLLLFYAGALVMRLIARVADRGGRVLVAVDAFVRWCLGGVWGAAILGLPLAAYFYALDGWPSWTGLLTPLALAPQTASLLSYGVPFAFGWLAHRQVDRLLALERRWVPFMAAAVALTVVSLALGGITPRWEPYLDDRTLVWYSAAYLVGIWCWIFGLIGLAVRYLSDASPTRRYLADSSYFLYLVHLPVLAFFAAWWNPLPLHWTIKYPLQIAATLFVLFVSYRYLVRSTFIGATLNGRRYARSLPVANPRPTEAT